MNKSLLTNISAFIVAIVGYLTHQPVIWSVGLFALSGAVTNWFAIHMLFEKVPGLYGSGVIPARFEDFKSGISDLVMGQFFTEENIDKFLGQQAANHNSINITPVINKIDLSPAFDALLTTVEQSSFGGMLSMFGGTEALVPLKEPYIRKLQESLVEVAESEEFNQLLINEIEQPDTIAKIREQVATIVQQRLDELTPSLVKEIIQTMIRKHLGWLVVWGGVFGGLIGLIAGAL
ncbi:DUF445 domain-containing protein [Parashewanella spongiae]|uniref:DUF445 domain-containing protein n=1 Tax=Parashewanella spongiae TaxID=342950 RepID=A0A3A6UJQ2_9GAMM|nr:DUF445 domain-containing protein [Parashewanella spongiae]MCL1078687.1 DUF445 domain-containing protein [Parashewanella spongiae]RJY19404.1 DUF445 domain-containing protein [Parashewanella spongiae]